MMVLLEGNVIKRTRGKEHITHKTETGQPGAATDAASLAVPDGD
jgi:hypothetical protein